ncbi:MAG: aspartyl protease family protein, partial [Opitutaceae bacterium]|nr:aspartyl protease family protein [Opitutaceae bacterium]
MPRPRQNIPAAPARPAAGAAARRVSSFPIRAAAGLLLAALMLAFSGCANLARLAWFHKRESRPGQTRVRADAVEVKSQVIGSHFMVEAKWGKRGPWRFLIDTGSSVTLVSEEFYKANAMRDTRLSTSSVGVRSASGQTAWLQAGHVREIQLGGGG